MPTEALKPGDRLFSGDRRGYLAAVTDKRAWAGARTGVLTPHEASSLLGKPPYDLRHTSLTDGTWLNAGVPAAQVAAWAGDSVRILLATHIDCVDGGTVPDTIGLAEYPMPETRLGQTVQH